MTATAMALLYGAGGGNKKASDGVAAGGIRHRRVVFFLLLICCSPILIPFLFLASPLIALCFVAVCLRRPTQGLMREDLAPGAAEHPRALLHRYLEDQLGLALAFVEELGAE